MVVGEMVFDTKVVDITVVDEMVFYEIVADTKQYLMK
jgi:hypothetical protein